MKAGFASVCITPPIGTHMMGYAARTEGCLGVFDDLYAQSLALSVEGETLVLVAIDISALGRKQVKQIHEACSDLLPPERIWLNTSHTHAGPIMTDRPTLRVDQKHVDLLTAKVREIVGRAIEEQYDATLKCGEADVSLGCNRRITKAPGETSMGPNLEGATLPVMSAWVFERDGADDIVVFSTPQHGVTMGKENRYISAEWMGITRREIERELTGTSAMFLQGCAGDQNPWRDRRNYEQTVDNGVIAATAALQAISNAADVTVDQIAVRYEDVEVPVVGGSTWTIRTQCAYVGDALLISFAGETFVEYAMHARRVSSAAATLALGYTQGSEGYIGTHATLEEGGYEAVANNVFPVGAAFDSPTESLLHAAVERLITRNA